MANIKRRMLAITMTAAAAAGLGMALAGPAAAAVTPSCRSMGAYVTPVAPSGSWNSSFSHKVVCDVPVIADVYLFRNGTQVASYEWRDNWTLPEGGVRNATYAHWPIFCGSRYQVKVGVMNAAGGSSAIWYWTPDVVRC